MVNQQNNNPLQEVTVSIEGQHYETKIKTKSHNLTADEPIEHGGKNTGPTPYELLLGSLGACTAITLRMYADRKKWEVEGIHVILNHDKVYAEDCEDCESSSAKIDKIDRKIIFKGNLTKEQKDRLLQIADKCPVHKTLQSEIHIKTSLDIN